MAKTVLQGEDNGRLLKSSLLKAIDHTLLKPDALEGQVLKLCDEAMEYGFASVCVNPCYIEFVANRLASSEVLPCCVIGFPLGATLTKVKAFEAEACANLGAKEVDMVINNCALKSGAWELVYSDIKAVRDAIFGKAILKVIIETSLLTDEEKVKACLCAKEAGAEFVKTSTGFIGGGATAHDVRLMRSTVGEGMGVKASGGIRDYAAAIEMLKAGANRLGTSSGVAIAKVLSEDI